MLHPKQAMFERGQEVDQALISLTGSAFDAWQA